MAENNVSIYRYDLNDEINKQGGAKQSYESCQDVNRFILIAMLCGGLPRRLFYAGGNG